VLLENRNAVIYGAGGSIGGAVARAFAREGAQVFLAGRTEATLEAVADDIRAAGRQAETAVVDALEEEAVDRHADAVVAAAGSLDISFNLIATRTHTGCRLPRCLSTISSRRWRPRPARPSSRHGRPPAT
jgi:3-oxoacyl-[acyl-carrier protein] reductase